MDGGEKEKEKAKEIKAEVNKQRKRGRYKTFDSRRPTTEGLSRQSQTPSQSSSTVNDHALGNVGLATSLPTPQDDNHQQFCMDISNYSSIRQQLRD